MSAAGDNLGSRLWRRKVVILLPKGFGNTLEVRTYTPQASTEAG